MEGMSAFRFLADDAPAGHSSEGRARPRSDAAVDRPAIHPPALGVAVERWLREADGRLVELEAPPPGVPRADDFGHVTPRDAAPELALAVGDRSDEPACATPASGSRSRATDLRDRSGIVVAAGWGERPRRY